MSDTEDERIERDSLTKNLSVWLAEAYRARQDLLSERKSRLDEDARKLRIEIEQLERKAIRLENNLKRMSVADLRVLLFVFSGHENQ